MVTPVAAIPLLPPGSPKKTMDTYFKLSNAPDDQPLALDLEKGKFYMNRDADSDDSVIDLRSTHSVARLKSTLSSNRPEWLQQFFCQMNDYVSKASTKAAVDESTGQLELGANIAKSDLKNVCDNLAWLYEAQHRQNKEILLWIGEIILDYMARDTRDLSIEEAIEELGLLKRENGVKWSMKTLAKWPIVVQKIPAPIRQLPIPPTYLSEAALFAQPEDAGKKLQFNNARDAMLVAVSESPDSWTREKFVSCMKELQEHFGVERIRNEGVAALQERLIAYYRIRHAAYTSGMVQSFYKENNIPAKDVATWIYNIESELVRREKLPPDPLGKVPTGDGLTQSARDRISKQQKEAP
ncbi:MAG: hypothetical protein CL699_06935 [Chloroflexi bacterium]|nr:hypothetical protein [Chloroflexota bacterium]MAO75955.1 hypothetical protein [Chloroflexota bacterium]MAO76015.1 hypothetical protein [Chloroflexota bacterium]|tara:strand:- start:242 stop:1303 length:1062 start_codon:yes stop_codon:yes gene_type:complete